VAQRWPNVYRVFVAIIKLYPPLNWTQQDSVWQTDKAVNGWVTSKKKMETQTMMHWTLSAALSPHSFNPASVQKVDCSLREVENLTG